MSNAFRGALIALFSLFSPFLHAKPAPLHTDVLVFVPAYEGCELFDPTLESDPVCVWGNIDTFLSAKRYFALRLPNRLEARTMRSVGPIDIYGRFIDSMTHSCGDAPGFTPYTEGSDFFVFNYDWRLDLATSCAPQLGRALDRYARIHAAKTGIPAGKTRFIIVTHSMGGLVARTLLGEQPQWAPRIKRLYLVGSPNAGSVKAIGTLVNGPDSLRNYASGFAGMLLHLVPTSVDQKVTKLTGITRPSLYELLPTGDPHWTRVIDGRSERMTDAYATAPWKRYWPSAELEQRLFIDGWLKPREAEKRKQIIEPDWIYCRDKSALDRLMDEARDWRRKMGTLRDTDELLTESGASRLRLIASTGLKTPCGVLTTGTHDGSRGYYPDTTEAGDGTVELARVLEGMPSTSPNVKLLKGVAHGKLMGSGQLLDWLRGELKEEPLAGR